MTDLIFYDSEFTSFDPMRGEILSLAMVKESGEELYIELEHSGYVSPWAQEFVVPHLKGKKVSLAEARRLINDFLGAGQPRLVAYVHPYDVLYLHKLFEVDEDTKNLPYNWLAID